MIKIMIRNRIKDIRIKNYFQNFEIFINFNLDYKTEIKRYSKENKINLVGIVINFYMNPQNFLTYENL